MGYLFGGSTGLSYDELQRRREASDLLKKQIMGLKPKTAMEGAGAVLAALGGRFRAAGVDKEIKANTDAADAGFGQYLGTLGGSPSADVARSILTGQLYSRSSTAGQVAATSPGGAAPAPNMSGNEVYSAFVNGVKSGGVENPYALAAVAATGKAESGYSPGNVNRTWADPSQSGQAGTAGGVMSWRAERLANLQRFAAARGEKGNGSPETQAAFFVQEDPSLIQRLNQAKSTEEAQTLMNNAWKFAGYDRPGGEAARRQQLASSFLPTFQGASAPREVASLDPSIGMPDAAAAIERTAPGSGYVDPYVSAPNGTPPRAMPVPQPRPDQQIAQVAQPAAQAAPQTIMGLTPELLQQLSNPWLSNEKKAVLQLIAKQQMEQATQAYERQQKQNDPSTQLDMDYRRAQIDALRAKPEKSWQRLDDDTLFNPETGETKSAGGSAASGQPFRFSGNSVEAQALNGLIESGQLTPGQAQQLGAGKTVTAPDGSIMFMTPQGVFSQPGGEQMPSLAGTVPSQGGNVLTREAMPQPMMPGAPGASPAPISPVPQAGGRPASPAANGMIRLTEPKNTNAQIPAEMGARIGMGDAFLEELPAIREKVARGDASGLIDGAKLAIGVGAPMDIWRDIETGRDALVRNLTGAGMSASEANNQAARYQISPTDTSETMLSKLDNLERDLRATRAGAIGARTNGLGPAPTGADDPLAAARAAIAKGAPREAVIQRLRQSGINPEGL
ncbi:phage tail tip lysozyme [Rhizobium sp. YIM 134829]|uniref:phage tail tip lysozyme n=1 Tax=Rhizobium sp. YIM 134829 TaxID=3390453 RepID=UPI00397A9C0B